MGQFQIERTEWNCKNQSALFKNIGGLFPQLTEEELTEVDSLLQGGATDYFEIPHYPKNKKFEDLSDDDFPDAIFVVQNGSIFYDILNLNNRQALINDFRDLAGLTASFIKGRPVTDAEMEKRFELIQESEDWSLEHENDFAEEDDVLDYGEPGFTEDFEVDEEGVTNREAFYLIAKQPAIDWLNEVEIKLLPKNKKTEKVIWNLENVNDEPSVYLVPDVIEQVSEEDAEELWCDVKQKAFRHFLNAYYMVEELWPDYTDAELFEQWFEIKRMGLVYDLEIEQEC